MIEDRRYCYPLSSIFYPLGYLLILAGPIRIRLIIRDFLGRSCGGLVRRRVLAAVVLTCCSPPTLPRRRIPLSQALPLSLSRPVAARSSLDARGVAVRCLTMAGALVSACCSGVVGSGCEFADGSSNRSAK